MLFLIRSFSLLEREEENIHTHTYVYLSTRTHTHTQVYYFYSFQTMAPMLQAWANALHIPLERYRYPEPPRGELHAPGYLTAPFDEASPQVGVCVRVRVCVCVDSLMIHPSSDSFLTKYISFSNLTTHSHSYTHTHTNRNSSTHISSPSLEKRTSLSGVSIDRGMHGSLPMPIGPGLSWRRGIFYVRFICLFVCVCGFFFFLFVCILFVYVYTHTYKMKAFFCYLLFPP